MFSVASSLSRWALEASQKHEPQTFVQLKTKMRTQSQHRHAAKASQAKTLCVLIAYSWVFVWWSSQTPTHPNVPSLAWAGSSQDGMEGVLTYHHFANVRCDQLHSLFMWRLCKDSLHVNTIGQGLTSWRGWLWPVRVHFDCSPKAARRISLFKHMYTCMCRRVYIPYMLLIVTNEATNARTVAVKLSQRHTHTRIVTIVWMKSKFCRITCLLHDNKNRVSCQEFQQTFVFK